MSELIHHAIFENAERAPHAPALAHGGVSLSYADLASQVATMSSVLLVDGLARGDRVAVFLEKRIENVVALFGAAAAGCVFVPINPLLRPEQVAHILKDCNVRTLITSNPRLAALGAVVRECPDLKSIFIVDPVGAEPAHDIRIISLPAAIAHVSRHSAHRVIDVDMAAILYTSGSTGKPKGVVLSHRNLVAGAASVSRYLGNTPDDRILCVLPLSFDYGLSQLTTAFHSGAAAVLMNYLVVRDIGDCIRNDGITGLAAVPPLWIQLARHPWPDSSSLRYITNSGGAMPRQTLDLLRAALPQTKVFLMYGLTEAFRSTYLPPEELDRRPDSIGRAIPNADVQVVHPDGTPCQPGEEGELVHRGALVGLGYWNDPVKTAERFRALPGQVSGTGLAETAVWSGDTVRIDLDGFLYFVGRRDDLMKVSGYRVSPTEIEEVLATHPTVAEAVVFGIPDAGTGDAVVAMVVPILDAEIKAADLIGDLLNDCRNRLPLYMVPSRFIVQHTPLPRNPNGKFDRKALQQALIAATLETGLA